METSSITEARADESGRESRKTKTENAVCVKQFCSAPGAMKINRAVKFCT